MVFAAFLCFLAGLGFTVKELCVWERLENPQSFQFPQTRLSPPAQSHFQFFAPMALMMYL